MYPKIKLKPLNEPSYIIYKYFSKVNFLSFGISGSFIFTYSSTKKPLESYYLTRVLLRLVRKLVKQEKFPVFILNANQVDCVRTSMPQTMFGKPRAC